MNRRTFIRPTGQLSARIHGARKTLRDRRVSAYEASRECDDERTQAMLRGKARAYFEADQILAAIENGYRLPWKRR